MTSFSYQKKTGLDLARFLFENSIPEENPVIDSLAVSIQKLEKWIQKLMADDPDDERGLHDLTIEEGCLLDDLVGISFIVCQRGITSVVSNYDFLRKQWLEHQKTIHYVEPTNDFLGIPISPKNLKQELMVAANPALCSFSKIAMIDAFANYYKHRDEWTNDWKDLTKQGMRTVDVIRAAGADPGSLCLNCRKGYQTLTGETSLVRLDLLWKIILDWSRAIREKCLEDLGRCGCSPKK